MTALLRSGVARVAARVDIGRWLADCVWCNGALKLEPGTPTFDCWNCGATSEVAWPSNEMVHGIERLLMMRPVDNRWWNPGETLPDLMRENALHGIFDGLEHRGITSVPGTTLFAVNDDQVTVDALPALLPPPTILRAVSE